MWQNKQQEKGRKKRYSRVLFIRGTIFADAYTFLKYLYSLGVIKKNKNTHSVCSHRRGTILLIYFFEMEKLRRKKTMRKYENMKISGKYFLSLRFQMCFEDSLANATMCFIK